MGRHCPYCNQILPEFRLDVQLTPFQARIYDLVARSGRDGIAWDDLFGVVYGDGFSYEATKGKAKRQQTRKALKANIWHINEAIRDSGYRITGQRNGVGGIYRLQNIFTLSSRETSPEAAS